MVDRKHELPITRQCRLLGLNRSTAYYKPAGESAENLAIMRMLDELYIERPTRGSRTMRGCLEDRGIRAGRHRIRIQCRLAQAGADQVFGHRRTLARSPGGRFQWREAARIEEIADAVFPPLDLIGDDAAGQRTPGKTVGRVTRAHPHIVVPAAANVGQQIGGLKLLCRPLMLKACHIKVPAGVLLQGLVIARALGALPGFVL